MKKQLIALACTLMALTGMNAQTRADSIIAEINNPASERVLVAVHRGDWRDNPENSLEAIESAIRMGADIVEIDLALTKDSVLVVCHDRTLDRTATGSGLVSDHTLAEIKQMRLRAGHQQPTGCVMPTLSEALKMCRDRIVVNIDKGYQYYPLVQELADSLGMTGQLLIKGGIASDDVKQKFATYSNNMMFMPIIHPMSEKGERLLDDYTTPGNLPPAIEVCWSEEKPEIITAMRRIKDAGIKVWANTLWPSLNGGLCDDAAYYGDADKIYGALIDRGVTMIQTDRPALLLAWLRSKGLHN